MEARVTTGWSGYWELAKNNVVRSAQSPDG